MGGELAKGVGNSHRVGELGEGEKEGNTATGNWQGFLENGET